MLRLVLFSLLVASAFAANLNNTVMNAQYGTTFEGLPQITFINNEYSTVQFNWVFTSLEEYDANNNPVGSNVLHNVGWNQTANNQVDGEISFNNNDNESTVVTIDTQLYGSKSNYKSGGVPLYIPEDAVRWTLTVSNWTFATTKSVLVLKGRINGTINVNDTVKSTTVQESKTIGSYPSAFMGDTKSHLLWAQFAKEALYKLSGNSRNQDVIVNVQTNGVNGTIEFNVTFTSFNGTLVYNSAVSFQDNDNPSSGGSNVVVYIVVAVVCGAIIVIVIAVVIVLFLRRKRASYEEV
jgi:hypothetical protein